MLHNKTSNKIYVFSRLCRILTSLPGDSKYKKRIKVLNISKRFISYLLSNCLIQCTSLTRREKRSIYSTHSRPVKQALFTVRNNKLLRDICTLFADYLYSTQLGNKLKYTLTLISGM